MHFPLQPPKTTINIFIKEKVRTETKRLVQCSHIFLGVGAGLGGVGAGGAGGVYPGAGGENYFAKEWFKSCNQPLSF